MLFFEMATEVWPLAVVGESVPGFHDDTTSVLSNASSDHKFMCLFWIFFTLL